MKEIDDIVGQLCDKIINEFQNHDKNEKFLVCLAGPPGSGKSTISESLVKELNKKLKENNSNSNNNNNNNSSSPPAVIIPMDGYHLDNCILKERDLLNRKGSPQTFDIVGFIHMLNRLKDQGVNNNNNNNNNNNENENNDINKLSIYIPTFDRDIDLSKNASFTVTTSNSLLIVEGNYLLLNQEPWCKLKKLFNICIYVQVELPCLEKRLIKRWTTHNHNLEAATARALSNDIPNAILVSNNSNLENVLVIENNDK
ncbi:hypothetical protein ACTFIW_006080 [Dictyostelium discoideum]